MWDFFYGTWMYFFHYFLILSLILGELLALSQVITMIPEKQLLWQEKVSWMLLVLVLNFPGVILYNLYLKKLKK